LEVLFVATTLLALGILFRRLRKAEAELDQWRAKAADPSQPLVLEGEKRSTVVSAMTAILGQCDKARGQASLDSRLMQVIERHARRVWDLLERHSLPVSTPLEPVRPVIPEDLARAAIEAEGALAKSRDVTVHLLVDEMPSVKASAHVLANALQQLIRAAILSAPEGTGDVTVAVGPLPPGAETTHVGLCVADDGPGFDPHALLEILEPQPGEEAAPGTAERSYALAYSLCRARGSAYRGPRRRRTRRRSPGRGAHGRPRPRASLRRLSRPNHRQLRERLSHLSAQGRPMRQAPFFARAADGPGFAARSATDQRPSTCVSASWSSAMAR
jgi:hypothetical protein